MIKSVPIYDIDDSSIVVNTDDFGGGSGLGAVNSVNGQTGTVVLNQDNILDGTTAKQYTATEKTKLSGIQSGATANSTDAQLRDRTTHTGVQPISTITNLQTSLDSKQNTSEKGVANGYASLDGTGKVPSGQLPSYVDDVLEYANLASFPATGSSGIIYFDLTTGLQYRRGGSTYIQITDGKATWGGIDGILSNQTDLQTALNNKVDKIAGKGLSTEDYTTAEKTKLSGIQSGATANSTDVQLRDRTTHTGVQAISTITNLQTTLDGKANLSGATFSGAISATNLSNTNTGDQTSIVGITGTKTQFNTSLTDGDFVFTSDIGVSIQGYNANTTTLGNTTTGSGSIVLANSPTLTTPILGTPASGTLTNCTGLTEGGLTLADNTTNNVSTTKHGFAPKLPGNTTTFLRGDGTYAVPPSGLGGSALLDTIYCDNLISGRIKIQPVKSSITVSSTDFYIRERPIGSDIIVKIYKNGTEVISQNITPTGGTLTNGYYIFNNTTAFSVVSTDILDYKITQVGSSFAGYDLMITSI